MVVCAHRSNEMMYVKKFNEAGGQRRAARTEEQYGHWMLMAFILPPFSLVVPIFLLLWFP